MVNAPDLSLRGPNGAVAISGRQLRFRRGLPVIQLCTARLPRRFAPRNDTSGSAAVHQRPPAVEWLCTRRSVTALQAGNTYGTNSLAQCHQVCHCEEAAGRRGNLAVPDQITGKPSAKTQLPSRDCHVASLLAMTRQVVPWCISALLRLNCLVQGAHYPQGARRIRKAAKPPTAAQ